MLYSIFKIKKVNCLNPKRVFPLSRSDIRGRCIRMSRSRFGGKHLHVVDINFCHKATFALLVIKEAIAYLT